MEDRGRRDVPRLAIVAPCYNEEEVLPGSAAELLRVLDKMKSEGMVSAGSFLLFVNDGSRDRTWEIIRGLHGEHPEIRGLELVGNVGHQNAILAGMFCACIEEGADAVITIDVDLQDPVECIPQMVGEYMKGSEIVYGVREDRGSDTFFKRQTAESFYKLQRSMGLNTIYNHADFRLMSRRAVLELEKYEERNLYLRGIVPMMGMPSSQVEEVRQKRQAGETRYTFRKMMQLAVDGITSFSVAPMYLILILGLVFLVIAIGIGTYVIVSLCTGRAVPGWSSLMLSIWLVGGILMVSTGLVGLYVGKVFIETKRRPRYHVGEKIG